jgi:hypothetical protein
MTNTSVTQISQSTDPARTVPVGASPCGACPANGSAATRQPPPSPSRATSPWQVLYQLVIGFCLIPAAGWWWGERVGSWRLLASFLFVLLMLRVVPALARHAVRFPQDITTEWARRRALAKRFDSYQWRKLLWFGLGMVAYLLVRGEAPAVPSGLALVCLVSGGLGALRWRHLLRSGPAGLPSQAAKG